MLPRWPDRIVSPVSPHLLAAETIGPALKFWHGVGLTAWFVCEGPMSRTSIEDMETYYARDLEALEVAGAPVDRAVFRELLAAKRHLRERPRRYEESKQVEVAPGLSITIQTSFGATQYDGFEHLRDVITKFRRAWANAFLERYIRGRWDGEVRAAADVYNRVTNDAGKPPTARTIAPKVQATVNHWFGGDLAAFYIAIGAKAQIVTSRAVRFVPADRYAFMRAFVTAIRPSLVHDVTDPKAGDASWELNTGISSLARLGFRSLQLTEALGEPPALAALRDQFSNAQAIRLRNEDYRPVSILGDDPELAWSRFQTAIGDALRSLSDSRQVSNPMPELAVTSKDDRSIAAQPMAPAPPAPEHAVGRLRRLLGLGGR